MLDLRRLAFFVVVAETQNMSKAAELTYLSQSALSRQIQALEADLSLVLFDRIGKRLQLSAEGEVFLPKAQALLEQAAALTRDTDQIAQGNIGLLRVGATPQTIESILSVPLLAFQREWPSIELRVLEGSNDQLLDDVQYGKLHVAIAKLPQHVDLDGVPLFDANVIAVVPVAHPLAKETLIEVKALRDHSLLLLRDGFSTRSLFDHACADLGLRAKETVQSASMHTLCALAAAGHGVAIVSSTCCPPPGCVAIPLVFDNQLLTQTVSIVWNPRSYKSRLYRTFTETMLKMVPRDSWQTP